MSSSLDGFSERLRVLFGVIFPETSLAQIARKLDVSANTINNYLQGNGLPTAAALAAIADHGGDVSWLLTGYGTPHLDSRERYDRVQDWLAHVSETELLVELDHRLHVALEESTAKLKEVGTLDVDRVARRIRSGTPLPKLHPEDKDIMDRIWRADCAFEHIMQWYPDMDPSRHDAVRAFLKLHDELTKKPAVRTILYAMAEHKITSTSTA